MKTFSRVIYQKIYLKGRPSVQGPLFCHLDGKSLTRYQFVGVLKKALNRAGISDKGVSSHSFRIGAATSLAMEGVPESRIMQLGRCKSNAYKGYIRI
jgi:site-specific recombinase XerD